ncbi:unnamed protein product [Urochloa humidicola]
MSSTLELQNTNRNGAATSIAMNTSELIGAAFDPGASSRKLARALFVVGFLTLVMDLATSFYRPPGGVVFGRHRLAYYLTLAGIFVAGAAEVSAACWLSRSSSGGGEAEDRRRAATLARTALCCSLLPLVVVVALGGFAVLVKS